MGAIGGATYACSCHMTTGIGNRTVLEGAGVMDVTAQVLRTHGRQASPTRDIRETLLPFMPHRPTQHTCW